ncbi:uncharacterized protein LOC122196071 [Lactuca sativa]|uniref:uncharacterized protein LOC122196071 n=1 Tax=Lactuca sativa TaxID=4236 RepID=UPI001C687BB3|nr:uncharacterized protein LOC122196071 [Lactuca sativa]
MTKAGIPSRQILSSLRQQTPDLPAISRTIYNVKKKIRKENLGNQSMINALFKELEECGFTYDISHNPKGYISRLFIAHPLSIKLIKAFSHIFVMDCTYKTNKYNMPLLDIIGVSCFNTSFYSGFVFLEREDEENYSWALRAFKEIIGHDNQPCVIMSDRELALMNERISQLQKVFWTDKFLHFGNRSSSRAEGAHAKLKQYLQVSTGDLREVKEKICLAVEHEFNEIKVKLSSEKLQVPHDCNMLFFKELLYHISHFALKEINKQYLATKEGSITPCTATFITTMGLPCAHKIKYWQETTFSLDLIHPHWRIDTLSLNLQNDLHDEGTGRFNELLNELCLAYQRWPLNKKEHVFSVITKLLNQSDTVFEPVIQRPKGRPPKSKKEKRNNFHNTRSFKI